MRSSQNVYVLVSNRYDHLGRRVQKITPEATYTYFYDGWPLVKEVVERSGDTRRCGVSPRRQVTRRICRVSKKVNLV